jgi:hypothetical protein
MIMAAAAVSPHVKIRQNSRIRNVRCAGAAFAPFALSARPPPLCALLGPIAVRIISLKALADSLQWNLFGVARRGRALFSRTVLGYDGL